MNFEKRILADATPLQAPFPYFGGKARAANEVWAAFDPDVEAFAGSAAMLLSAPDGKRVETINDFDGFVVNFWRSIAHDPDGVAHYADWPCMEADLEARHAWLVNRADRLRWQLEDPDFYDTKMAGWWVWGACNWIGSGWCSGTGPHQSNGVRLMDTRQLPHLGNAGQGINRQLPHLSDAGQGINRKLPHLGDAGRGINRQLPHLGDAGRGINRQLPEISGRGLRRATTSPRSEFILDWMRRLHDRLRDVRVTCGDWSRVLKDSVTTRHGLTAVFLDPPYTKGAMDYGAGGMGLGIADAVRDWCHANGSNPKLRIVLCGHAGEHDALLAHGWHIRTWQARKGYALTEEATANSASETLWCSPHCITPVDDPGPLFA